MLIIHLRQQSYKFSEPYLKSTLALRTPCNYRHSLLRTKSKSPAIEVLTGNDSCYYRLSLLRTLQEVPSVSVITRVNRILMCNKSQRKLTDLVTVLDAILTGRQRG